MKSDNNNIIFLIPQTLISTLIAELITLPICTVKTVYQTTRLTTIQTIKLIYSNNGIKGFFSASIPSITSQLVSTTSKFTIYEFIKKKTNTSSSDLMANSISGMIGGIGGSIITHPFDMWKNFTQRNKSFNKYIIRCNNSNILIPGIYRGYTSSFTKNIVLYSMLFSLNDYYKSKFNSIWISAPLTTLTITCIIQPFDYYKTVMIAGKKPLNVFRGFHLMICRSIPHFTITMFLIEKFNSFSK